MKKQVSGYYQGYSSYAGTSSRSNRGGNLPSIFDTPGTGVVMAPFRNRPPSGLQLDVKGLPNAGLFLPTTPRERADRGGTGARQCSSDSTSDRPRQMGRLHTSHCTRDEMMEHGRRYSQPAVPLYVGREQRDGAMGGARALLTRRMPSGVGALPPIGADTMDSGFTSHVTDEEEEEEGLDSVFGIEEEEDRQVGVASESGTDDDSDSDEDDEEFLETESEAPPSRPGFESDAEKSAEAFQIPFPDVNVSLPFPVTLIQDQVLRDTERYAANITSTGLSPRVNNIVRVFSIHGPLDKELLKQVLDKIVNFHPLLSATFLRSKGQLYAQTPSPGSESVSVPVESPVVGHEQLEDLILNARRRIFPLHITNAAPVLPSDPSQPTSSPSREVGKLIESVPHAMSLTSVGDADFGTADSSPTTEQSPRKRMVSFAKVPPAAEPPGTRGGEDDATKTLHTKHSHLPSLGSIQTKSEKPANLPLIRARLVSNSSSTHTLVLSFPRIVCDFWSSCLFMQQLTDLYSQTEKSATYRPSVAAKKLESKRHGVIEAYEKEKRRNGGQPGRKMDAATRLMLKRAQVQPSRAVSDLTFVPMVNAKLKFPQVAQREKQLLMMLSRDHLLAFWEGVVTATIRRERGRSRTKIVPPVRIPSGLGEMPPVSGYRRPQTSRLRPLTASRNRPVTARRQGGGAFGEAGFPREALLGPKTNFQFIKIDDEVCEQFKRLLPEHCQSCIHPHNQFHLFTLGTYLLLLGKCCRGWGIERHVGTARARRIGTARERVIGSSTHRRLEELSSKQAFPDSLTSPGGRNREQPIAVGEGHSPKMRGERRGARLDVGSFLIGVEVSLRDSEHHMTQGLFGPLTNDAAIRVNLSSSETFADLVIALGRSLQSANKHGHLPFSPVADEVGLQSGLPVKFSFLRHHDVIQVANPNTYFYTETAVGVVNQGLGRLGSNCFLKPLNSKLDDSCHLELVLWESYDLNTSLAGGLRYQPQVIKPELVEGFGEELCRLLHVVSRNPSARLLELAREIRPPFLSSRSSRNRGRRGLNQKLF